MQFQAFSALSESDSEEIFDKPADLTVVNKFPHRIEAKQQTDKQHSDDLCILRRAELKMETVSVGVIQKPKGLKMPQWD